MGGDISDPFWSRIIDGAYAVEPFRLTSAITHEAIAVNLRIGVLRPDGNPFAGVPASSGIGDLAIWLIYVIALFGLYALAMRRKQI